MVKTQDGPKRVATFLDGATALECAFCAGTGWFPQTDDESGDYIPTDPCPVCDGSAVNIVPPTSEIGLACRACSGNGRGWGESGYFMGEICRSCRGIGYIDLSALRSAKLSAEQTDIWSLLHPRLRAAAKGRFDSGHYGDAVQTGLKEFTAVVKERIKGSIASDLDGSRLMLRVFSPRTPIIRLANLDTSSGRDMQIGWMQILAGAMTGIRNPGAHENLQVTRVEAIHQLFIVSSFFYLLDGAT
jgi:uncharacterized protein (TIGR02391 family)